MKKSKKRSKIYTLYKLSNKSYNMNLMIFAKFIHIFMRVIFACDIPYSAKIGKGASFPHYGLGIVISPDAIVGENCHINQGVTIGGRSGIMQVPKIGDNVLIGANAIIIGPVIVGNNVQIGAGSVVVDSIPDNCVAVGVPAKVIKRLE